jgi:hypothetical protein
MPPVGRHRPVSRPGTLHKLGNRHAATGRTKDQVWNAGGATARRFRAMRSGGKVQPSARARVRTLAFVRLNAAAARRAELPRATKAIRRSSSCRVHKEGRTDPNDDGGFLLGNAWRRFHDQINREQPIGSCTDRTALDASGGCQGWVDRLPNRISTATAWRRGAILVRALRQPPLSAVPLARGEQH